MKETGRVLSVEEEVIGSTVLVDTALGATELAVESTDDFEEAGGQLQIVNGHDIQTIAYGPPDDEGGTLPLLSPLTAAVEAGDEVSLPGTVRRYAAVALEDAPDEAIFALIPHSLIQRLPAGVRDLDDLDAVSIIEESPGNWVVDDVIGRELARVGIAQTDWRNGKGLYLAGGDPTAGEGFFGVGVISAEMVAENKGPVITTFPPSVGNDTIRRIGRTGPGSGPVIVVTDFPAKVTISGIASVINTSADDWNARFYLIGENADTGEDYVGRQGTQYCASADGASGHPSRHRQIANERQLFFDGSPDAPTTMNFWWGFTQDVPAGVARACEVRNLKMTLRVSYAPDMPIDTDTTPAGISNDPDREPAWTTHDEMKATYLRTEENAELDEV